MTDTTHQHARPIPLHPRGAREILGVALELYRRHPLTLIALVAVMLRICEDCRKVNP
jgi:hypothetical protein